MSALVLLKRGYTLSDDGFIRHVHAPTRILGRVSGYPPKAYWYQLSATAVGATYDPPYVGGLASVENAFSAAVEALRAHRMVEDGKAAET